METIVNWIGNFFSKIWSAISDFVLGIWNFFIDLLSNIFPREFSIMIAIIILCVIVLFLFRMFMDRDKR